VKGPFQLFPFKSSGNLQVMTHFAHNVCLNVSCNNAVTSAGNKRSSFYMKIEFRNSKRKSRYFALSLSFLLPKKKKKNPSQVVYKKSPLQLG
jgi:hypothetical protein